jgi:hypothetical protein
MGAVAWMFYYTFSSKIHNLFIYLPSFHARSTTP